MIAQSPRLSSALFACAAVLLLGAALPAAANAKKVGKATAVNQAAKGQPPGGSMRTVHVGDHILHNERMTTNQHGQAKLLLADGTSFTVGPNSNLTINSFVYNPNKGSAKVAATVSKGAARFVGGRTAKTKGGAKVHTPVGTVGIRGGIANIDLTGSHCTPAYFDLLFSHRLTLHRPSGRTIHAGCTQAHFDLLSGKGLILHRPNGRTIHIDKAGHSIAIKPDGTAYTLVTPDKWDRNVQQSVGGTSGRHAGAHTRITDAMVQNASILSPGNGGGPSCGSGSSSNQ